MVAILSWCFKLEFAYRLQKSNPLANTAETKTQCDPCYTRKRPIHYARVNIRLNSVHGTYENDARGRSSKRRKQQQQICVTWPLFAVSHEDIPSSHCPLWSRLAKGRRAPYVHSWEVRQRMAGDLLPGDGEKEGQTFIESRRR
ncbi:hypothetical protein CEXT_704561 [Caerostris extrusa]|uniref:Uncharacterized protein n=1 Tax=Caerostris extrusa TaxID=172846 RepID=A0AAV4NWM8_CAEEX|nr:hypothetical protein CEXT_704561 [Caerostris extrusa]